LVFLAIVVIVFEVTIRHAPADGLVITRTAHINDQRYRDQRYQTYHDETTIWQYSSFHDQAIIDDWNHELNTGSVYAPSLLISGGCRNSTEEDVTTMKFTWHGLPVQVWSATACSPFTENSGGLPNVF